MQEYAIVIENGVFIGMYRVAEESDYEVLAVKLGYKSREEMNDDEDLDVVTIFDSDIDDI